MGELGGQDVGGNFTGEHDTDSKHLLKPVGHPRYLRRLQLPGAN